MIILMGVAGAGKSYQGKMLADKYGYTWISTGEILRKMMTGDRHQEMLSGKLLSDDEVIALLDRALEAMDPSSEFVLDGFPRTVRQADWLLEQIQVGRLRLTAVINLVASEEVVLKRLLKRGRQDDVAETIKVRFDEYKQSTLPILQHFREAGLTVSDIDASQTPAAVHAAIMAEIPTTGSEH